MTAWWRMAFARPAASIRFRTATPDRSLRLLRSKDPGSWTRSDQRLVAAHLRFDQRASAIIGGDLPGTAKIVHCARPWQQFAETQKRVGAGSAIECLISYPDKSRLLGIMHWSIPSLQSMDSLFPDYGYAAIFMGICLESTGLPLPGESLMIAASIYAATTHRLDIFVLVPVAAAGAICGDQIGYFIGRWIGIRALKRWGNKLGLTDERLELGRFLFRKYGGPVVFFGRFVALLRTFAALLAGANRMPWHTFLVWNSLGGLAWTGLYGFGAYILGDAAKRLSGPVGIGLAVVATAALISTFIFLKRNEKRLIKEARRNVGQ